MSGFGRVRWSIIGVCAVLAAACTSGGVPHQSTTAVPTSSAAPISPTQSAAVTSSPVPPAPSQIATAGLESPIALCDSIHELEAPADWYRDVPRNEELASKVQDWARGLPGFEGFWIDRDLHNGWISIAISHDAAARQADVAAKYPDAAVVVVPVDRTTHDLAALAKSVTAAVSHLGLRAYSVSDYEPKGVVEADIVFLEPAVLSELAEQFGTDPVCVDGQDPALKPKEGPQPLSGDGWRLLADQDRTGAIYRTDIAYDASSYASLWREAGIEGAMPAVDFNAEVAIWFGAVHGSSCPRLRLDDVVVDGDRPLIHGTITELDYGMCTADALPHAYVVALERAKLPHGPFAIQLGADDPPPGATEELTIVDADLSAPSSTAEANQVHSGGAVP